MNLADLNLDAETDPALAFSELCAAFEEQSRLRAIAENELQRFTSQVAVRLGSHSTLRSPDELIEKLDAALSGKVEVA